MQLSVTIEIWDKENWFLAKIPELDFITQGRTIEEAKKNLFEVVQIQFEEMKRTGTLDDFLDECGFILNGDIMKQEKEIVRFEKELLQVA